MGALVTPTRNLHTVWLHQGQSHSTYFFAELQMSAALDSVFCVLCSVSRVSILHFTPSGLSCHLRALMVTAAETVGYMASEVEEGLLGGAICLHVWFRAINLS